MSYTDDDTRWACATVSLFHLQDDAQLHPIAIVIDYKASMKNSVVIFNKNAKAVDPTTPGSYPDEANDWPWRYAKTCAQVADWVRHELAVHLTNTHLIEEAIIVATNRSFKTDHVIHQILHSHWFRTLSLNASARSVLVPEVICKIVGFSEDQSLNFVRYSYDHFDWQGSYIPKDLEKRGFADIPKPFDIKANTSKYRNYAYARIILPMWDSLRRFVDTSLRGQYKTDADVKGEAAIKTWCNEVRGPGKGEMKSFPETIETIDQLVDVVTMCIHIASPQHTAVNYLQQYYQTFVPNKPSALCTAPPKTLDALKNYGEDELMAALPLQRPREWLLASHVPWLLSYQVESKYTLIAYAKSQSIMGDTAAIRLGATALTNDLAVFPAIINDINSHVTDNTFPYEVLMPEVTAVSILI